MLSTRRFHHGGSGGGGTAAAEARPDHLPIVADDGGCLEILAHRRRASGRASSRSRRISASTR
jgi:hypothetical protein